MIKQLDLAIAALEQMSCITAADKSLGAWCRDRAREALAAIRSAPVETLADDAVSLRSRLADVLAPWFDDSEDIAACRDELLTLFDAYRAKHREGGK